VVFTNAKKVNSHLVGQNGLVNYVSNDVRLCQSAIPVGIYPRTSQAKRDGAMSKLRSRSQYPNQRDGLTKKAPAELPLPSNPAMGGSRSKWPHRLR
jgi:hypothetical protein